MKTSKGAVCAEGGERRWERGKAVGEAKGRRERGEGRANPWAQRSSATCSLAGTHFVIVPKTTVSSPPLTAQREVEHGREISYVAANVLRGGLIPLLT